MITNLKIRLKLTAILARVEIFGRACARKFFRTKWIAFITEIFVAVAVQNRASRGSKWDATYAVSNHPERFKLAESAEAARWTRAAVYVS